MNRREYMAALGAALTGRVSARERADILRYYEEYFDDAGPEREAEVIRELGDPRLLAERITREEGQGSEYSRRRPMPVWLVAVIGIVVALTITVVDAAVRRSIRQATATDNRPYIDQGTWSEPDLEWGDAQYIYEGPMAEAWSVESFDSVTVDVDVADVYIQEGDRFDVFLDWNPGNNYSMAYEVDDGELYVSSRKTSGNMSMGQYGATVVITVPYGAWLDEIRVSVGMGNIWLMHVSAEEAYLKTGMGDVDVNDGCMITDTLCLTTGMGDASIYGDIAFNTEIEAGMGNVQVLTSCAARECGYDISTGLGIINVDGEEYHFNASRRGGDYSLRIECGTGTVSVEFS